MKELGLTTQEAKNRLEKYGPNLLPEKPPPGNLELILTQFKSPLVYVLVGAGAVTFLLHEYTDTAIISLAVGINTILGFFQERRAGKALEELKKLVYPHARVIRNGNVETVGTEEVVIGDIALLTQGNKVPADGVLLDINRFYVSEAMLTGESAPEDKKREDQVFMGTIVTAGTATMRVTATGAQTEMGKIAQSVSKVDEPTPLKKQLKRFSKKLSIVVLAVTLVVFVIGVLMDKPTAEIFTTSVALAVSAIPEGLLVGLTVILAIGMQRILKKKGLVRNLASAETLGGVTTICTDKTGTLTKGDMQVADVIAASSKGKLKFSGEEQVALQVVVANDRDDPMVVAAWEWGNEKMNHFSKFSEQCSCIDSIPFSADARVFISLNKWDKKNNVVFVNGAPEVLVDRSNLSEEEKQVLYEAIENLSDEGKRLLGLARKFVPVSQEEVSTKDAAGDLEWIGLLSFSDPVRDDVARALEKTREAGIKLVIITGDYAKTAISVLRQLGLKIAQGNLIEGYEIDKLADDELERRLTLSKFSNEVVLFARTKPNQKLRIVEILKKKGEVVAMMGDGVNDAPALAQADIGIVVGEASDVSKESADLVLIDSSFSTIVAAIEEGRGIFDNIRKMIMYLMSDAFVEIIVVIMSLIFRLPLPLTVAQILWVNLVSDGFPDLALTVDPKAPGIMRRPPRHSSEALVTHWMYELIAFTSVLGGVMAFLAFAYVYTTKGDLVLARSVVFATVGINSLVYVFSIKTLRDPFWKDGIFNNKWLVGAVGAGFVLQISPYVVGPLRGFFGIVPIGNYWFVVFGLAALLFFMIEVSKWIFPKKAV